MKKQWYVTVVVMDTVEVEAESHDEAAELALEKFDVTTAEGPSVHHAWEKPNDE